MRIRNVVTAVGIAIAVTGLTTTCTMDDMRPPTSTDPRPSQPPTTTTPTTVGAIPDYDRDAFPHWGDLDGDGCDARDEILRRDAFSYTLDEDGCIDAVTVIGPYTGQRLVGSADIDVDHVVSLYDAWYSGAYAWSEPRRERLANDPTNLLAVQDNENQSKGSDGPDEWRPPKQDYWCEYGRTYATVKEKYGLRVSNDEWDAIEELLATC